MYARMVTGHTQSGKADEFAQTWRKAVLPDLSREPGFQGASLLKDEAENTFVAVALFDTEANVRASETGYAQQRLPKVAYFLDGKPISKMLEVVVSAEKSQ